MASSIRPRSVRRAAARAEAKQALAQPHSSMELLLRSLKDNPTFDPTKPHFSRLMADDTLSIDDPSFVFAYTRVILETIFTLEQNDAEARSDLALDVSVYVCALVQHASELQWAENDAHPFGPLIAAVRLHAAFVETKSLDRVLEIQDEDEWRLFLLNTFVRLTSEVAQTCMALDDEYGDAAVPLSHTVHLYSFFMAGLQK